MEKKPLIIKDLSIQKMPGFPRGLASYKGLANHINIISGPNTSGKSSTARMIKKIIWPIETKGIQAACSILVDKEPWEIKIDSQHIITQREGKNAEMTGLPVPETGNRYILALDELITNEDQNIAQHIARESIGGFDLDQARNELEFDEGIKNTRINEYKEYQNADRDYKEAQKEQEQLKDREEELSQLYDKKEDAQQAARLRELYEIAVIFKRASTEAIQRAQDFNAFSAVYEKMTGEEYHNLEELENDIEKINVDIENNEKFIVSAREMISGLSLPEVGINDVTLDELEEKSNELTDLSRRIQEEGMKLEAARSNAKEALKAINTSADTATWKGINLEQVSSLDEFLTEAHKFKSEAQYLETRILELSKERIDKITDEPGKIREGINYLTNWLQEYEKEDNNIKIWPFIMAGLGVITALATKALGYISMVIGGFIMAGFGFYLIREKKAANRNIRRRDYEKTGLTKPEKWDHGKVAEQLTHLVEELEKAEWNNALEAQLALHQKDQQALGKQLENIDQAYNEWMEKLKIVPGLPQDNIKNYSGLAWFLTHAKEWQKQHADAEAIYKQQEMLIKQQQHLLEDINTIFNDYNAEKAHDAIQARAIFRQLKKDENTRRKNKDEIKQYKSNIAEKQTQKQRYEEKLQAIYNKLGLPPGERDEVKMMADNLEKFKETKENHRAAQRKLGEAATALKEHSLYDENEAIIESLSPDQAEARVRQYEEAALALEGINRTITEIETKIDASKKGHNMEDALHQRDKAIENLHSVYDENLSSITGHLLVVHLKEETREKNRPVVFKRANELFSRITGGRYQLDVDDKFRAFDTVLKLGQPLDELSTGTRIQLLLAVRLAFIETQESVLKLPVIADELLANSDEVRAGEIINALIEISREGRQVFYFTAQNDEVIKWQYYLKNETGISKNIIQLTGQSNELAYTEPKTVFSDFSLEPRDIVSPDGHDHQSYGEVLEVPRFNLLKDNLEQLHLWYIMEDVKLLYNCLKKGIVYWGQMDSYLQHGGHINGMDEQVARQMRQKARVFGQFIDLYRQGRPRLINREVLESTGAVSGKFIGQVSQKLDDAGGDPQKLINALKNGEVSGFRQNQIEKFEDFLIAENYIPEEQPLDKQNILVQIKAQISQTDLNASLVESMIERVLNQG